MTAQLYDDVHSVTTKKSEGKQSPAQASRVPDLGGLGQVNSKPQTFAREAHSASDPQREWTDVVSSIAADQITALHMVCVTMPFVSISNSGRWKTTSVMVANELAHESKHSRQKHAQPFV